MIENYYITGLPIRTKELGIIHQPTIEEILSAGLTEKQIVQPFLLHLDLIIKEQDEELKKVLMNFDLFFITQSELIGSLMKSLVFLYRTENVVLSNDKTLEDKKIIVDDNIIINRYNFDSLADIVLGMFCTQRPSVEEEEKVNLPSEKHKKIWEKMQKRKKKKALKNQMELCDIINIVSHANGFIAYREVIKLTYYQLITSYKTMMHMESYKEFTQFKLSPKFDIQSDVKHWMNLSKISKMPSID